LARRRNKAAAVSCRRGNFAKSNLQWSQLATACSAGRGRFLLTEERPSHHAMGDDQRFEKWASGILGVVSLILIVNLARMVPARWRAAFADRFAAPQTHPIGKIARLSPLLFPQMDSVRKAKVALPKTARPVAKFETARHVRQPEARRAAAAATSPGPNVADAKPSPAPMPVKAQASPAVTELQSIGYVERPDGSRQAAVSVGNQVFLVHEGDTFDDQYRVLKISRSAVEVADLSAPQGENAPAGSPEPIQTARQTGTTALASTVNGPDVAAQATNTRAKSAPVAAAQAPDASGLQNEAPRNETPGRYAQFRPASEPSREVPAASSDKKSAKPGNPGSLIPVQKVTQLTMKISAADEKTLGYVERPGRPAETIVAKGDEIRLVPERTVTAENSGSEIPPLYASAQDVALRPSTLSAERASGPADATVDGMTLPKWPPAALGTSAERDPKPRNGRSDAESRQSGMELSGGATWQPSSGDSDLKPSEIREVSARASPASSGPSRAGPRALRVLTFQPFCYVERADRTPEAFVALGDQAYLVREGELFADRYRVLKISPLGVDVEDELWQENKSPPVPSGGYAENGTTAPQSMRLGNRSMPDPLPWEDIVRSLAVVSQIAGPRGTASASALRLFAAQVGAQPTLRETGSSTLSVRGAESLNPPQTDPGLTSTHSTVAKGTGGEAHGKPEPDLVRPQAGADVGVKRPGPNQEPIRITPLPLTALRELIQLPDEALAVGRSGTPAGSAEPGVRETNSDRVQFSTSGPATESGAGEASTVTAAGGGIASVTGLQTAPGNSLLLHFSIGDNGCYFPR
jgi:hypothetical protein